MGRSLGELEVLILLAIVDLEEEAYGAAIGRTIEDRTGRAISAGAIYTALERLTTRGFVTAREGAPTPRRGGRRTRLYRIEPEGARELQRSTRTLRDMAQGLLPKLDALAAGESA
ncbi:MAG: PadR family transcriptional regulator [Gemmatimonadota bacterium]